MEGDCKLAAFLNKMVEISIHALRVEGDFVIFIHFRHFGISIHALRVEGDEHIFDFDFPIFDISIHALRVEGDTRP